MSDWKVFYENAEVNPAGLDGFAFLEYASKDPQHLQTLFGRLGFIKVATHKTKAVELWQQGDIKFVINSEPGSYAEAFVKDHGACACGMGFAVNDAEQAFEHVLEQGARAFALNDTDWCSSDVPVIFGIGDSMLYLVDHNIFEDFDYIPDALAAANADIGLTYLDHVTHNLFVGAMDEWATFYGKLFNFTQIKFFDIQGQQTGLTSRALQSPCGKICIPLNEPKDDKSQIKEFTDELNGEGIQHIALGTNDIYKTVETLRELNQEFMPTPDTYYRLIEKRLPGHPEPVERMHKNGILVDGEGGAEGKHLLQIFTKTEIGPVFFEIIQRKGDDGFGEGNFQALFESIELDQVERGYLKPTEVA